jgi:arabinogalactan endo-1,4-beta-galactosidase
MGGASGGTPSAPRPFILGADISSVPEALDQGALFVDTDGVQKPITDLLKAHGFNFVRLRTFVDPANLYGYANPNGDDAYRKAEPYCDSDHTVEFGRQVKEAGMGLLVDLHYSDNWADPGKQIIPERWRGVTSIDELAEDVKLYTSTLVQQLVDAGARPDIIQIGNEITPGMLIQVPSSDPKPDQWGNLNKITNTINGSASNWANLGLLLKKGAEGVRSVDPDIKIMLHIENTSRASGVVGWVNNARSRGVEFDILGLSCYTTWQGQPDVWENTFRTVADAFPDLTFAIAEYGLERRRANDIMHDLTGARGLGTFLWEPTQSGVWGSSMFTYLGNAYQANAEDFAVFDAIRSDYGLD